MSDDVQGKYALADTIAFQITSRVVDTFQLGGTMALLDKLPVDQFAELIADRVAEQLVDKVAARIADEFEMTA